MRSKQTIAALMGLALLVTGAERAWATAVPTNDTDSLTITITPNIDRGVQIDTDNVVMDLGTVDLGTLAPMVPKAVCTSHANPTPLKVSSAIAFSYG